MIRSDEDLTELQKGLLQKMDFGWMIIVGDVAYNDFFESDEDAQKIYDMHEKMKNEQN